MSEAHWLAKADAVIGSMDGALDKVRKNAHRMMRSAVLTERHACARLVHKLCGCPLPFVECPNVKNFLRDREQGLGEKP